MKKIISVLLSISLLPSASFGLELFPSNARPSYLTLTGITDSHIVYVDGGRTDSYVATGQIGSPYKDIDAALDALAIDAATHSATYEDTKYIINVAPGTYDEALTIGNFKYLRINLNGAIVSGNIAHTTTQQTGDYYSKLEWFGGNANRPEKGEGGCITGNILASRNNDSLMYVSYIGMNLEGNMKFVTNGTWVVMFDNCFYKSGVFITGDTLAGASMVLIETDGQSEFDCHISSENAGATNVAIYNGHGAIFDLLNLDTGVESRFYNCRFESDVTIADQALYVDANSYKSLVAQTETISGATLSAIDGILPSATTVSVAGITNTGHTYEPYVAITDSATLTAASKSFMVVNMGADQCTITLPAVSGSEGLTYKFVNINANDAIISGNANINGAASYTLDAVYDAVTIVSNGTQWYILNDFPVAP